MNRYACARAAMAGESARTARAFSRREGLWELARTLRISACAHAPMTGPNHPNLTIPHHQLPPVLGFGPGVSDTGGVTPFSQPSLDLFVSSLIAGLKRRFSRARRRPPPA